MDTLLVVDDEIAVLNTIVRSLRIPGLRVLTAHDGEQGLEKIRNESVDIILSDQKMPGLSGVEFLSRVQGEHPNTVRMMMTAYPDVGMMRSLINEVGIFKLLLKPWNQGDIKKEVNRARRLSWLLKHEYDSDDTDAEEASYRMWTFLNRIDDCTYPEKTGAFDRPYIPYYPSFHDLNITDDELEELFFSQEEDTRKAVTDVVMDILNDREICKELEITFTDPSAKDVIVAHRYAMHRLFII